MLVLLAVLVQVVALRHELALVPVDLNDNVMHRTLVERAAGAVSAGDDPLEVWVPEWALGYPVLRTYQPLAHLLVVAIHLATTADPLPVFAWVRLLLVCLLPASMFVAARSMGLGIRTAAASALLAPLVATDGYFGIEYGSYLWRGKGLFTQSLAMHLMLLGVARSFRAVRRGRGLCFAGAMVGLTFLAHYIYGYMAALSVVLLALLPDPAVARPRRLARLAALGIVALSVCAFQIAPLLADADLVNLSRWEPGWKWESFGASRVLAMLLTGEVLDHGRLPVLSLTVLVGAIVALRRARRNSVSSPDVGASDPAVGAAFVLAAAVFWLVLWFGRPAWGPLLVLLGAGEAVHLHRLIGGAHVFLALLGGMGLAGIWGLAAGSRTPARLAVAWALCLVILTPALVERAGYVRTNREWGEATLDAWHEHRDDLAKILDEASGRPGRVYPGLAAGWGGTFTIGWTPVSAFVSGHGLPAVSRLYHAMSLPSDVMVHFDEWNPAHYRLFNVTTVVAEPGRVLPAFLKTVESAGRFRSLEAPGNGYFDVVEVPGRVRCTRRSFYDVNENWLESPWMPDSRHLLLDFDGSGPADVPRLSRNDPLPPVERAPPPGRIDGQSHGRRTHEVSVDVFRDACLLFKVTYHPNWVVRVDGERRRTVMLSPGFAGVALEPGTHRVVWSYRPDPRRTGWILASIAALVALGVLEATGRITLFESRWVDAWRSARRAISSSPALRRAVVAAGLTVLSVPVWTSMATTRLTGGHDALEYLPRLVEFHESVRHGILWPQWAADLSSGFGQPFFVFSPPLFYYLAEVVRLTGAGPTVSINVASVLIVAASGGTMYLLAKVYFGSTGGWLAAAAYVYAPYFHVVLYVRKALAELTAFALFPLALYGLARYGATRERRFLVLGAAGYAGVLLSHHPAALLFTMVLVPFTVFTAWRSRSAKILAGQAAGLAVGLGLAAPAWLPALVEMRFTRVDTLTEGYLRYANHFVHPHQLVHSAWGYGLSTAGYGDGFSLSLGWSHLVLAAAAWWWWWRRRGSGERAALRWFTGAGLVLVALMLPGALWIWDHVSLLQYVEFPWRLLGVVNLCLALVVGSAGPAIERAGRRRAPWLRAGALALLILPNLSHARPEYRLEVEPLDWTPAEIARRGIAVTTKREFEPRWVERRTPRTGEAIRVVEGNASATLTRESPERWTGKVVAETSALLETEWFYFPGWTVRLDGERAGARPAAGSGLLRFPVPAGDHALELVFSKTRARTAAQIASVASLVLAGVALARRGRKGS